MKLKGGYFDGKEIPEFVGRAIVMPVVEECGDHFANYEYDRSGQFVVAWTWIGDRLYPERFPRA